MKRGNIIVLNGGLGNQLFQISFGFFLEQMSGVESLFETSIGNPRKTAFGDIEASSIYLPKKVLLTEVPFHSLAKRGMNKLLRLGAEDRNNALINTTKAILKVVQVMSGGNSIDLSVARGLGFFDLNVLQNRDSIFLGYFQSYMWVDPVNEIFFKLLPRDDEGLEKWQELATYEKPIALHLRLGDYKNERFGIPNVSYYKSAIDYILTNGKDRNYNSIWVFSDEPLSAKEYLANLAGDMPIRFIDSSKRESAWTMQLMRFCSAYVIGNSTFSWWGSYLRYDRMAPVIAPTPWFNEGKSPNQIQPPDWFLLPAFDL